MNNQTEKVQPVFFERQLTGDEPAWCIDGRPDFDKPKGVQMLGGSLQPILLYAIYSGSEFTDQLVTSKLSKLSQAGYTTGVHWGSHKNETNGKSDCAFADSMATVLQVAVTRREDIAQRLNLFYGANSAIFEEVFGQPDKLFSELLDTTYEMLTIYQPEKIKLAGDKLISAAEQAGAIVENLQNDHAESAAFVNLRSEVTFDTNQANSQGTQAFNLDLVAAVNQAEKLGVERSFAIAASLILYQATEMILVEDKGKAQLPLTIHS